MTEQIEPCPNPECGGECNVFTCGNSMDYKEVACVEGPRIGCGYVGPEGKDEESAIALHNRIARAVREATDWRQRAEAAEAKWAEEVESQMDRFSVYRHRKTGRMYVLLAGAYMESDGAPVVCYKSLDTGKHYVRPDAEFFDPDRFERIGLPARPDAQVDHPRYPRCTYTLRAAGKPYPRTCQECGLGPCKNPARPADGGDDGR